MIRFNRKKGLVLRGLMALPVTFNRHR